MNNEARENPGPEDALNVNTDSTPSETRRWAMVPGDVLDMPMTLQELRLFVAMSVSTDGRSRTSAAGTEYLAGRIGRSRRWTRELLRGLEKHDLIRPTATKGPHGSTVYLVAPYPEEIGGVSGRASTRVVGGGISDVRWRVSGPQVAGRYERNSDTKGSYNQREPVEVERDPRGPAWDGSITTVQNPKPEPLTDEKATKDKAVGDVEFDKKEART